MDKWCDPVERTSLRSRSRRQRPPDPDPYEDETDGLSGTTPWGPFIILAVALLLAFIGASVHAHQPPSSMSEYELHTVAPMRPPFWSKQMTSPDQPQPEYGYGPGEYRFSCLHRGAKVANKESPLSPPLAVPAMPGSGPLIRLPSCPALGTYARVVYYRPGGVGDFLRAGMVMSNRKGISPATACCTGAFKQLE